MRYKSALFFISECIELKASPSNKSALIAKMGTGQVLWDDVVKIASKHLVLPLIYIRLEEHNLLSYLPDELRAYLEEITRLNRERNKVLLSEVEQLNKLLSDKDIKPIFLKGTALLIKGLYSDIGERMIADIDILVAPEKMEEAAELLIEIGYKALADYDSEMFEQLKHYPRLVHPSRNFGVEIHKDVIENRRDRKLLFNHFDENKDCVEPYYIPSTENLILHSMINCQINDFGYILGTINLRQQYDLLILSQIKSIEPVINAFPYFNRQLNAYLIKTHYIFKNTKSLSYKTTLRSKLLLVHISFRLKYPRFFNFVSGTRYTLYKIYKDFALFCSNLFHPIMRKRMLKHLGDRKYIKAYLVRIFSKIKTH